MDFSLIPKTLIFEATFLAKMKIHKLPLLCFLHLFLNSKIYHLLNKKLKLINLALQQKQISFKKSYYQLQFMKKSFSKSHLSQL